MQFHEYQVKDLFLKIQRMSEHQSLAALFCKELYLTSSLKRTANTAHLKNYCEPFLQGSFLTSSLKRTANTAHLKNCCEPFLQGSVLTSSLKQTANTAHLKNCCEPFLQGSFLTSSLKRTANQFTKELNFRRFVKTRNGGIISDVLHCSCKFPIFFKI